MNKWLMYYLRQGVIDLLSKEPQFVIPEADAKIYFINYGFLVSTGNEIFFNSASHRQVFKINIEPLSIEIFDDDKFSDKELHAMLMSLSHAINERAIAEDLGSYPRVCAAAVDLLKFIENKERKFSWRIYWSDTESS